MPKKALPNGFADYLHDITKEKSGDKQSLATPQALFDTLREKVISR